MLSHARDHLYIIIGHYMYLLYLAVPELVLVNVFSQRDKPLACKLLADVSCGHTQVGLNRIHGHDGSLAVQIVVLAILCHDVEDGMLRGNLYV